MKEKLDIVDKEVKDCQKCLELVEKFNNHTSVSYGKDNKILIVGEAPANNGWRKSGRCWYGIDGKITGSGKIITKLFQSINLNLEDIFFVEAIKCFPIERKNLKRCKDNCYPYLEKQITLIDPKIIITLGDTATKSVLKDLNYHNFSEVVGKKHLLKINNKEYIIVPIYHPSPISPRGYKDNIAIFNYIKTLI